MARITWQNVDSPDFRAAIAAQQGAADLFSRAAGSIGSAFEGFGQVQAEAKALKKNQASAAALDKMLRYQDSDAWGKAMQEQGLLQTLGISPDMASDGLLKAAAGYGQSLDEDRRRDLTDTASAFDLERGQIGAQRSDLDYARQEEDRTRGLEAARIVDQITDAAASPEAAAKAIRDGGYEPRMEQALYAALEQKNPATWATSPDVTVGNTKASEQLSAVRSTIGSQAQQLDYNYGLNPLTSLVAGAGAAYDGSSDIAKQMLDRVGAGVTDEEQERFEDTRGQGRDLFNSMVQKYNRGRTGDRKVPEAMIAAVMERTLEGDAWLSLLNDGEQFDTSEIENQLDQLSDPNFRNNQIRLAQDYENGKSTLDADSKTIDRLEGEILRLRDKNGSEAEIQKRIDRIDEIAGKYGWVNQSDTGAEQRLLVLSQRSAAPSGQVTQAAEAAGLNLLRDAAQPEQAATSTRIDPRAEQVSDAWSRALSGHARLQDNAQGELASLLTAVPNGLSKIGAYMASPFAPEFASDVLRQTDAVDQTRADWRQNGLRGAAAQEQSAPAPTTTNVPGLSQERADTLVAQSAYAPSDTLELVGSDLDMPARDISSAKEAMSLLTDQGVPANVKNQARAEVQKFIERARKSSDKGSPEVRALIERAEEWLNI